MAQAQTPTRQSVLNEFADGVIAERVAESEAAKAKTEAERAERKRRAEAEAEAKRRTGEYFAALDRAEAAATALVAALHEVHAAGDAIREGLAGVRASSVNWSGAAIARRLSRYLSAALHRLPSTLPQQYGDLRLALPAIPPRLKGANWRRLEAAATGNSAISNQKESTNA